MYNGKAASEWFADYNLMLMRHIAGQAERKRVVDRLRQTALFPCDYCVVADMWAPSLHAVDLRVHGDKRVCKCCCDDSAANAEAGECETPLPAWGSLTEFDPFVGLL